MKDTYEITTLNDIANATDEGNLEAFLVDLKILLEQVHALRSLHEIRGIECPKQMVTSFKWVDDGEHNSTITIEGKENT